MGTFTKLWHPARFQGERAARGYFEGWYFKVVDAAAAEPLAIIPGVSIEPDGRRHALSPGVMGPFRFAPFMECYHGVLSLDHSVDGTLEVDGERISYEGGRGYTEKDWGRSFPSAWVWVQSNDFGRTGVSLRGTVDVRLTERATGREIFAGEGRSGGIELMDPTGDLAI